MVKMKNHLHKYFSLLIYFNVFGYNVYKTDTLSNNHFVFKSESKKKSSRFIFRKILNVEEIPTRYTGMTIQKIEQQLANPNKESKISNIRPVTKIDTTLSQSIGLTFLGATQPNALSYPPDTNGAVGPMQFVVSVNSSVKSFNKTNGEPDGLLDTSLAQIFGFPAVSETTFAFQSQIRFDRISQKWFIVASITKNGYITSTPYLAISDTNSLSNSTNWTILEIAINQNLFAVFPTLGIDEKAIYVATSGFNQEGTFVTSFGFVINKQDAINGTLNYVVTFENDAIFTPQGVNNFDKDPTKGYFAGVASAIPSELSFIRVDNTQSSEPELVNLNVGPTIFPVDVKQPESPCSLWGSQFLIIQENEPESENEHEPISKKIQLTSDIELLGLADSLLAAHIRDNKLWTVHQIRVNKDGKSVIDGDRNASKWYQINLPSADEPFEVSLRQSGQLFDNSDDATSFWMGSIMTSGQNNMALGSSKAGPSAFPNAVIASKVFNASEGTIGEPLQYTFSDLPYGFNPNFPEHCGVIGWGDYSYTSLDPNDNMTFWTIQEFSENRKHWGVQVAKLLAPPPATPISATPSKISVNTDSNTSKVLKSINSVDIIITGESIDGSAFYDPGIGFPDRLQVSANNGVIVNDVTYIDPTHIRINVSTANAIPGFVTLTITNPDGQSVTTNSILEIVGFSPSRSPISEAINQKYCQQSA